MTLRDSLIATFVATVWGFNFVVIAWGMPGVPPLLFAAIRFVFVAVPAVFLVPRPQLPVRYLVAVGAFMSVGQFAFLYSAMAAGMPAGLAALVLQSQVVFTVAVAAVALRERPGRTRLAGMVLAVAGLVLVGLARGGHVPMAALVLCLGGGLSWGVGNVVSRVATSRQQLASNALGLTIWSALVVPMPLFALSLVVDGPTAIGHALTGIGWHAVLSTAYTVGIASILGYSLFNGLLMRNPASSVVPFVLIAPPVAMVSAWALLGENSGPGELLGAAVVLAGVLVTTTARQPVARPLSVYDEPRPASRWSAASIRRAVKSAHSSRASSSV